MRATPRPPTRPGRSSIAALSRATLASLPLLAMFPASSSGDDAFLRGDSNGDGRLSISDGYRILQTLFMQGEEFGCVDAADVNDSGGVNVTDAIVLLHQVILQTWGHCAPFPDPGADPNEDSLGCLAADGGPAVVDPSSEIRILDAVADGEGRCAITVLISTSRPVAGLSGRITADARVLANKASTRAVPLVASYDRGFVDAAFREKVLYFGFLTSFTSPLAVPPGDGVAALEISACIEKGTPAGDYALTLEEGELVDFETARSIAPALVGATLTVPGDLDPDAGCESEADPPLRRECAGVDLSDPPDPPVGPQLDFSRGDANTDNALSISDALMIRRWLYDGDREPPCLDAADADDDGDITITDCVALLVHIFLDPDALPSPYLAVGPDPTADSTGCAEYTLVEPEETDDLIDVGDVEGAPGQWVAVPVYLTNAVEVEAFQLVVAYDPDVFTPATRFSQGLVSLVLDDSYYDELDVDGPFLAAISYPEDGVFVLGFVPSLIHTGHETPAGEARRVFNLVGVVSPYAEPGTEIALEPTNGPGGLGFGPLLLRNELTYRGGARYAGGIPRTDGGVLRIIPDILILRGDSNADRTVNLTDAVYTLGWLFLGGPSPRCLDEADVNDDGILDVSDPIATLSALFLGGADIAPPFPEEGHDATPDALPACR